MYDLTTFATNGRGDEDALASVLMEAALKGWIEPFSQDNLLTRPVDTIMGRTAFEVLLKREFRAEFIELMQNIGFEEV